MPVNGSDNPLDRDARARIFDASLRGFRRRDEVDKTGELTPEQLARPVTWKQVKPLFRGIGKAVSENLAGHLTPLRTRIEEIEARLLGGEINQPAAQQGSSQRIEELEKRIRELEARQWRDGGVWKEGTTYLPNEIVTDDGSGWICKMETKTRPPGSGWRLLCKRGRDGKDARK